MTKPAAHGRDWATTGALEQHPLGVGAQPLEVRHMCPECAGRGGLCPVCLGIGTVDTDRLERHNAALWAAAGDQQPVTHRMRAEPI